MSSTDPPSTGNCPMRRFNNFFNATSDGVCPVSSKSEPPNTQNDHSILDHQLTHMSTKVISNDNSDDPNESIPGISIPSTGRGNSENGTEWLNPSANQLFRSLQKKNKPIEKRDAMSMAAVHAIVTQQTWEEILKYEQLHYHTCKQPKLSRFEGKDGIFSPKARFCNLFLNIPLPYDRHDWIIDRCGQEIHYVIDYYAIPTKMNENEIETETDLNTNNSSVGNDENVSYDAFIDDESIEFLYTIDARPKFNSFTNILDRVKVSFYSWKQGQSWF